MKIIRKKYNKSSSTTDNVLKCESENPSQLQHTLCILCHAFLAFCMVFNCKNICEKAFLHGGKTGVTLHQNTKEICDSKKWTFGLE